MPDGRVVSLWLGADSAGTHQIKVMDPNGENALVLTSASSSPFPEVDDVGLGCGPSFGVTGITMNDVSDGYSLQQNYPNPFNPSTTIAFSLPRSGYATLKVYDALGREVVTLVARELMAGSHDVDWNASALASGVYFYRLFVHAVSGGEARAFVETKKLVLLR